MIKKVLKSWWMAFIHRIFNNPSTARLLHKLSEVLAMGFLISSTVLTYLYGQLLVLPELLETYPYFLIFMRTLGTWIIIAIFSNLYLVRKRHSSIKSRMLTQPIVEPISPTNQVNSENEVRETTKHMGEHFTATPFGNAENWHICAVCEVFVPPRTWHCNLCKTCILRRDHHCIFTGCCIGEENQSNFMGLLFYLAIGTTLSTIFALLYHLYILDQNFWTFLFRSIVVVYNLLYDFDVKYIISAISALGHILAWDVFLYYFYNSMKGQTSADADRGVCWTATGCGRMSFDNFRDFLGPQPILRILWPFHPPLKINYDIVRAGGETGVEDRKGL